VSAMTWGSVARATTMPLRSPLPKAAPRKATPLRLVPQRRSSAARAPFVAVVVALLGTGLLGLLLLNTLVAQGSFALHDLSTKGRALQQQEQELARQVQALQAPGVLAARATALGMVPGSSPAFLRLPDGKVLGVAVPGVAPVVPPPAKPATATTATTLATTPATKAAQTPATKPAQTPKPATKPGTKPAGQAGAKPAVPTTGAHR
jgi:hypothetical protein